VYASGGRKVADGAGGEMAGKFKFTAFSGKMGEVGKSHIEQVGWWHSRCSGKEQNKM
jgi:hypothetical protein